VDFERFERELHELFDDFPASEHPRGQRFDRVLEDVPGLARENNLALLNLAASMVEPGESYVEIGTHHGTSLIAAMIGNEETDFVAVDNFSFSDGSRERLDENLSRFGMENPTILEGDAFQLIPGGALGERRVSVYYYDNGHEYEQQLDGLRMVEPWLAERALLIVDDTDWERVERALDDYLAEQPRARRILTIDGSSRGSPQWWEGMQVLVWDAPGVQA
jgi:protein O-GlcNAc transferase